MGLEVSAKATISNHTDPLCAAEEMNKHYTVRKNKFNALLTSGRAQMTTFMKKLPKDHQWSEGIQQGLWLCVWVCVCKLCMCVTDTRLVCHTDWLFFLSRNIMDIYKKKNHECLYIH